MYKANYVSEEQGCYYHLFRSLSFFSMENYFIKPFIKTQHPHAKRQVGADSLLGFKMTVQDPDYFIREILLCLHALPRIAWGVCHPCHINENVKACMETWWDPLPRISVFSGRRLKCKGALHPLSNPVGHQLQSHSLWPALKRWRDERRKETCSCQEKRERGAWAWNAPGCICPLVVCHYIGLRGASDASSCIVIQAAKPEQ